MAYRDYPKHERARAAQESASGMTSFTASADKVERDVPALNDEYRSLEQNERAMKDARRKMAGELLPKLAPLRERYERALGAAPLHTRSAYLRKHGLTAEPGAVALLEKMPALSFVQLVEDAAARGDLAVVGAALALGRSLPDLAAGRRFSAAVESVDLPEQEEAESQLKAIRDAYLTAEALYRRTASPEAGPGAMLQLAHATAAPLVTA